MSEKKEIGKRLVFQKMNSNWSEKYLYYFEGKYGYQKISPS
jgi:hypothetical protein